MNHTLPGWEDLRHSGLLLDAARLEALSRDLPAPLDDYTEQPASVAANLLTDLRERLEVVPLRWTGRRHKNPYFKPLPA